MSKKTILLTLLFLGIIVLVIVVYRFTDPIDAVWMPKCFSYSCFGVRCPGCGTQRALHSLFMGDVKGAFMYNPLLVVSVPYFVCVLFLEIKSVRKRYPRIHHALLGQRAIWVLLAILLIYTLVRNYFEF